MNKALYNTSIPRLMLLLLPTPLRRPLMAALTAEMATPFAAVLGGTQKWHTYTEHRAQYNGQACRLAMMLNDILDPDVRGFRVEDGEVSTGDPVLLLPRRATGAPSPLRRGADGTVTLPTRAASQQTRYDFTVIVPGRLLTGLTPQGRTDFEKRLAALVNTYKLPTTKWNWQAE